MKNAKLNLCNIGIGVLKPFFLLLLLLPLLSVKAQTIRFRQSKVNVKTAIEAIEQQANYSVDYTGNLLNLGKMITVKIGQNSLKSVMQQIMGNNLTYSLQGHHIILSEKIRTKENFQMKKPAKKKADLLQDMHTLKGVVIDNITNDPLIGATIKIKGQLGGTVTDINGEFTINVSVSSELTVSYIGYKTRTVAAGDLAVMTIKMVSANDQVGEVVVVGAGTQRKISVTGAITSISGDDLKSPSSSLTNALAGKLAGVISMTNSGEPGSTSQFYIRGVGTFGGRTTPLILLDDVEISAGDLNNIPPESIKSFTILKDASATAIYGARGANGVMLITTKDGAENSKTQIHVTVENSFLRPVKRMTFVDGARFMELYNEADLTRNPNDTPKYTQEEIDNTRKHVNPYLYPDVDWYGLLFKNSNMDQRANVNISGGGSRATYFMSMQVNHNTGLLNVPDNSSISNNINQFDYIFQNNISYKLSSSTKVDLRINTQITNSKGPASSTSSLFYDTYNTDPISFPAFYPAQEGDKHIRYGNNYISGNELNTNPYAAMLSSFRQSNTNTVNTSLHLSQDLNLLTKGLNISALANWKNYYYSSYTESMSAYFYRVKQNSWSSDDMSHYTLEQLKAGSDYISQSGISKGGDNTFYLDTRLNYNRSFGPHNITGMLMYMMREYRTDVLPHRNQGWSGRFTYDYKNKYLAEFNFGYNGTERLVSGHRFEFFPAMSLGWVVSSENFWIPISKYIDFLKLRGSYGLVGSDETGESAGAPHYLYRNIIIDNSGRGAWMGIGGANYYYGSAVNSYAVENGHWERAKEFDLGLDMHLFNQINVVFDYFYNKRDRILMQRGCWPDVMGYWAVYPWSNIGKVDNKGFELSIDWTKKVIKDLSFEMRANFTYNKNKYVYKDEPNYSSSWLRYEGQPLDSYQTRGYIAEGLFENEDEIARSAVQTNFGSKVMPGDIKYRDINGDGAITADDKTMISPYGTTPRIQYGIGLNIVYKKLDFGVFFNGSAKRTIMLSDITPFDLGSGHGPHNVMKFIADNYWSESNPDPNAKYPRLGLSASQTANNTVPSTYWMRSGNFLRWKTLEIGYTFRECRIYLSGDNLAVWSPFKLWDPELSGWNSYPLQRTFNIGIQIKF